MISFVVPAHNEQAALPGTLSAIHAAAEALGQPYEILVVNDASTDATTEVARQHGARVVPVNHRQIAATRNSGARAALGEYIFFVDADTKVNLAAIRAGVRAMARGAAGGGGGIRFTPPAPLYMRLLAFISRFGYMLIGFTGGAFMFCTATAFKACGGFDERLFWAEEASMALALRRHGRFVVVWSPVETSPRRFNTLKFSQMVGLFLRMIFSPFKAFTHRSSVAKIWYDSNRANDDKVPSQYSVKLANAFCLVIVVALIFGPVWMFMPWSWTPWGTPLGWIRMVVGAFLSHAGLFCWVFSLHLVKYILRQRLSWEWARLVALTAFCLWNAWNSTLGVIWCWTSLYHWLVSGHS